MWLISSINPAFKNDPLTPPPPSTRQRVIPNNLFQLAQAPIPEVDLAFPRKYTTPVFRAGGAGRRSSTRVVKTSMTCSVVTMFDVPAPIAGRIDGHGVGLRAVRADEIGIGQAAVRARRGRVSFYCKTPASWCGRLSRRDLDPLGRTLEVI